MICRSPDRSRLKTSTLPVARSRLRPPSSTVRPIACLITDRHRLPEPTSEGVLRQVVAAAAAGIQLIQIRERGLEGRQLFELTRRVVDATRGTPARVLVNDRLDIALAARAHGVHLRGDSGPASRVRAVTPPGFLIGRSVHSVAEAAAAGEVDYLLFGNVFETGSKPGRPGAGLQQLSDVVRATTRPVLAVGGLSAERVPDVMAAGAAGFAAISMFAEQGCR